MDVPNPPAVGESSARAESEQPASALERLIGAGATKRELGGNRPLRLHASDQAWLVSRGRVEIFAVSDSGARTHLATVRAGEMLFGLGGRRGRLTTRDEEEATSAELLAVAHPETELHETETASLTRLAGDPDNLPLLEAAIEGWVSRLFRRIPRSAAPQDFVALRPGTEVTLAEGGIVARTESGVVWIRHVAGRSGYLGQEELVLGPSDALIPVTEDTWVSAREEAVLSCVATGNLLRSGAVWESLRRFHELFLRYVSLAVEASADDERRRLSQRLELDDAALQAAQARLASVLRPSLELGASSPPPVSAMQAADAVFQASRLVAERLGLALTPAPREEGERPAWRLRRICEASHVRYRRVILRDDWWCRDNGPLLGFLEKAAEPADSAASSEEKVLHAVALLPTSPTSYELVDPAGERRPIDGAVAEELAGYAYMFYPTLPERRAGAWDLLGLALRGRRRDLLTILLMGIGAGVLSILVPVVTEQLFGRVIPSADRGQVFQMTLILAVAALGAAAFQITRGIAILRLSGKVDGSLQAAIWDRLLALPISFYRRFTVGDLTNRAMGIEAIRDLVFGQVVSAFLGLVFSAFSYGLLFYYSVELAFLATLLIAALLAATAILGYLQLRHQRELLRIQGKISSLVFGFIRGISKLHASGAGKRAYGLWAERFAEQRQRTYRVQRLANLQTVLNATYGVVALLALFALMGLAMERGLSVSRFLAFTAAFGQVQAAALAFVSLVPSLLTIIPIYERLQPILEAVPEVDAHKIPAGELSGDIEFSQVSFRYHPEGPLVLNGVSFRARPGEFVALVGPSGSGKSTCLRLLLGFEQPQSGSIYYDGQDLASLDLPSVRRQIGVVLQNAKPLGGTIFGNIIGTFNLGIEAAWEAARMAGLEEDIKELPMGMHTVVSEGADTFSGGQLQRLMIARAIVNRPRVVYFDEATSALDNRAQEVVSRSLEQLKATRIVIAHRLSTIRNADRIYVLENGRIVEEGDYETLLRRDGLFGRLAKRQIA